MKLRTSVTPQGHFKVGLHKPFFDVSNLRQRDWIMELGQTKDGQKVTNKVNFPAGDVHEQEGRWIFEVPNPLPFRGTTFIDSSWAAAKAADPFSIKIKEQDSTSLLGLLGDTVGNEKTEEIFAKLPASLRYAVAAASGDAEELVALARGCCRFIDDQDGNPTGLLYKQDRNGQPRAVIEDFELFETIANNPALPDAYKEVMVLRPGVQGGSEIVGEFQQEQTHVFEYLRRNSYIPWGHFAANMAHDAIRYNTADLTRTDMQGLRFLYYQRMYVTLAQRYGLDICCDSPLEEKDLENLRQQVLKAANAAEDHPACLWGWNYGYDFSPTGYRLHASHQMIHQQYAMVPELVTGPGGDGMMPSFSSGDMVADVVERYKAENKSDFFSDYIKAIRNNTRLDQASDPTNLIVFEDAAVLLFVPKAQVSQWELQLMVQADQEDGKPVGNILEANTAVRQSIDKAIFLAQKIYAGLGARMVTSIEYGKRIGVVNGQRLLYSFLPKLPWSMGAFSEAQLRFICGHFPEDFAKACRHQIPKK